MEVSTHSQSTEKRERERIDACPARKRRPRVQTVRDLGKLYLRLQDLYGDLQEDATTNMSVQLGDVWAPWFRKAFISCIDPRLPEVIQDIIRCCWKREINTYWHNISFFANSKKPRSMNAIKIEAVKTYMDAIRAIMVNEPANSDKYKKLETTYQITMAHLPFIQTWSLSSELSSGRPLYKCRRLEYNGKNYIINFTFPRMKNRSMAEHPKVAALNEYLLGPLQDSYSAYIGNWEETEPSPDDAHSLPDSELSVLDDSMFADLDESQDEEMEPHEMLGSVQFDHDTSRRDTILSEGNEKRDDEADSLIVSLVVSPDAARSIITDRSVDSHQENKSKDGRPASLMPEIPFFKAAMLQLENSCKEFVRSAQLEQSTAHQDEVVSLQATITGLKARIADFETIQSNSRELLTQCANRIDGMIQIHVNENHNLEVKHQIEASRLQATIGDLEKERSNAASKFSTETQEHAAEILSLNESVWQVQEKLAKHLSSSRSDRCKLEAEVRGLQVAIQSLKDKEKQYSDEYASLERELQSTRQSCYEKVKKLDDENAQKVREHKEAMSKCGELEAELQESKAQYEALKTDNAQLANGKRDMFLQIQAQQVTNHRAEEEIRKLNSELRKSVESLKSDNSKLRRDCENLHERILQQATDLNQLSESKEELRKLKQEVRESNGQSETLKSQNLMLQNVIRESEHKVKQQASEIVELQKTLDARDSGDLKANLFKTQKELDRAAKRHDTISRLCRAYEEKMKEAERKLEEVQRSR